MAAARKQSSFSFEPGVDDGATDGRVASVEDAAGGIETGAHRFAAVAVPVPNLDPLTYELPTDPQSAPRAGMRCRVPLGKRVVDGVIVELLERAPDDVVVRSVAEIVDREPVFSAELLELGRFLAEYYLAPIGEVLKSMLPAGVSAWGRERIRITNAGALVTPDDELARRVLDRLRDGSARPISALTGIADLNRLWPIVNDLRERGWIRSEARSRSRGQRYGRAYELASGKEREQLLDLCGRSKPGRLVVETLLKLDRSATQEELLQAAGCGAGVLRRLVRLGVLREFVEVRTLDLGRHRLSHPSPTRDWVLTGEQQAAVDVIRRSLGSKRPERFLLHGVTGSGKTEVYLRAAQTALEANRTALILVPEIGLVPALARQVRQRFGDCHAILHSGLSQPERVQEWQRIRSGAARVVVGPRSALFAPLDDLGLLVVDEEHDASYKQESTPRYHGRDMAYVRARNAGATLVLGSATPSLESRHNVQRERLKLLTMRERVGEARLPEGVVVDLRREARPRRPGEIVFSRTLIKELQDCLDERRQAILLRNRRGYAPVLLCSQCGHDHACEDCGLAQTVHRKNNTLRCHYCGASRPLPDRCADCASPELDAVGAGTERVEEQVRELFPQARVEVLDRDTARGVGLREILERFGSGECDILVGTQMVAKGHHFPNVALAAVLNADTYLSFPDFRGVERAYSLLAQLSGRAGRGEVPGKVVIQTRQPDHYAVRAALDGDDARFAEQELRFRRSLGYPPFVRLTEIITEDRNRGRALDVIEAIAGRLRGRAEAQQLRIMGPKPPPLERLAGRWRFQLVVAGNNSVLMRELVEAALPRSSSTRVVVDVDPCQLF